MLHFGEYFKTDNEIDFNKTKEKKYMWILAYLLSIYIIFMACIYVINALLILSKYINACVGMRINTANFIVFMTSIKTFLLIHDY